MRTQNGYIALFSTMVVTAIFLLLFAGMLLIAVGGMQRATDQEKSVRASSWANTCIEESLNGIRKGESIGEISFGTSGDGCEVESVEEIEDNIVTFEIKGEYEDYIKTARINVHITEEEGERIVTPITPPSEGDLPPANGDYFIISDNGLSNGVHWNCGDNFTDGRDNNVYSTIEIAGQCWMADNLAYLPQVNSKDDGSTTDPRYYVYDYDGTSVEDAKDHTYEGVNMYDTYGVLYNWPAAENACPDGWRLATDLEWYALENYLDESGHCDHDRDEDEELWQHCDPAGAKMAGEEDLWDPQEEFDSIVDHESFGESGFDALPAGRWFSANGSGAFDRLNTDVYFWSSTSSGYDEAFRRHLWENQTTVHRYDRKRDYGYSVRCVKEWDCGDSFVDPRDGELYDTVEVDGRCWMADNLAYLPQVNTEDDGSKDSPRYYVYDYDGTSVEGAKDHTYDGFDVHDIFGTLYNWPAAKEACPDGWQLPTDSEWYLLENYLDESGFCDADRDEDEELWQHCDPAGAKMAGEEDLWDPQEEFDSIVDHESFGESGFDALPAGRWFSANGSGAFDRLRTDVYFWSSTPSEDNTAFRRHLWENQTTVHRYDRKRDYGYSVRCVEEWDCGSSFLDERDGNTYSTIEIGDQCWMRENLAYLPNVHGKEDSSTSIPRYYIYGYDGTSVEDAKDHEEGGVNVYDTYGTLYNWPAALNACPDGWKLPSDEEVKEMEMQLGMSSAEADELDTWRGTEEGVGSKWARTSVLWEGGDLMSHPNVGDSNLDILPSAARFDDSHENFEYTGYFHYLGNHALIWLSTETEGETSAYRRLIRSSETGVHRERTSQSLGFGIRCIKEY